MVLSRQTAVAALLLLANPARASRWTVTSYFAVKPTTSVWTAFDETYTDTATFGFKTSVTPTVTSALSTSTSTYTYDDIEFINIYLDGEDVDDADIMTTTSYDYDYGPATYYVQPIEYTAPSSCPTAFTVSTYTMVDIPSEVVDQVSVETVSTSIYTYADGDTYTQITAYLGENVASVTVDLSTDYVYSYFIADCRNPTATGDAYYGPGFYDDDDDSYGGGNVWGTCMGSSYCMSLAVYVIVLAALLPTLFILGFVENYFWFRRMMIGKFSLRFGTVLWIFLFLPVLCFTRQCPARDPQTQENLRQQWKSVSFGKALGLWFRWGFRHRYPVDLLGAHPLYHNPAVAQAQPGQFPPGQFPQGQFPQGQYPPGPPPPNGYVYYVPGPMPDGQQPGPPPDGFKGQPGMQQMVYYPQYPPQAYAPQNQPLPSAPSPASAHLSQPPSDNTQTAPVEQPAQPPSELSHNQEVPNQPGPSQQPANGTTTNQ